MLRRTPGVFAGGPRQSSGYSGLTGRFVEKMPMGVQLIGPFPEDGTRSVSLC